MTLRKGIAGFVALCFCLSVNASNDSQMELEMRTQASKKVHWCKPAKMNNLKQVQILSINDFHGQISAGKKVSGRAVGSAPVLISYLKDEQKKFNGQTFFVHAGDLVGASVPQSALLQDEPTIMILNTLTEKSTCRPSRKHPLNDRVAEVLKDGVPINVNATYSVTVNSFLAAGGDNFTVFIQGLNQVVGPVDLDALVNYTQKLSQPFSGVVDGRISGQ